MSASDEKHDDQASTDELLTNGVHRRNFLKFFAGAFAAAALPEVVVACSASSTGGLNEAAETADLADFTSIPMTWVTRKQDGLSLGFQLINLTSSGGNIALKQGAAAGSAYVAITFPPQHTMEDATPQGNYFSYTKPANAVASGTSVIVFNVPANYGTANYGTGDAGTPTLFPFTLQGMLELCALSAPVVAPNATNPNVTSSATTLTPQAENPEDERYEGISQARIDRVISRVDPRAAARVRRRAIRAARMINPELTVIGNPIGSPILFPPIRPAPTTPTKPTNAQTSLELPFRVLMSPDQTMHWSFMPTPVASPATTGTDAARTELWHARPGPLNHATGLAEPSLGGVTLRALYTRDYDIYGYPLPAPTDGGVDGSYGSDPVAGANPNVSNRDAIVRNTVGSQHAPLTVNHLMLSPVGGTLDVSAQFDPSLSQAGLQAWAQKTVLGRDEFVECINVGNLLPFGQPAALVTINKRAEDPTQGTVGVLYSQAYLVVSQTLASYHGLPNAVDYNTFPFVACELAQTKIPTASGSTPNAIPGGGSGWVYDPTGSTMVTVGVTGTDHRGQSIHFTTPLYFCASSAAPGVSAAAAAAAAANAAGAWNTFASNAGQAFQMQRQRIALAPTADSPGTAPSNYSPASTTFETVSFLLTLKNPTTGVAVAPTTLVPMASNLVVAVEAIRHLQTSPANGSPPVDSTFQYDSVNYAANGFDPTKNPHEIFLVQAGGATPTPTLSFVGSPNSGGLVAPALTANALSRSAGPMSGSTGSGSALATGAFHPPDYFGSFLSTIQLFGFVPLGGIIQAVENGVSGLASQYMPKSVTKDLSNAEAFLEKAVGLFNLLESVVGGSSGTGQATQILTQLAGDIGSFGQLAQGIVPSGGVALGGLSIADGAPMTNAQMQAAAWLQSAATQAQELIQSYLTTLTNAWNDAKAVVTDVTSLNLGQLITADGKGDLHKDIGDLLTLIGQIEGLTTGTTNPQTAAGAVMSYFGPVATAVQSVCNDINGFLTSAGGVLTQLIQDLSLIAQGLDMAKNLAVEFKWTPLISGIECWEALAFIPSTNKALSLDIKVNANSNNGPTGLNMTCRLDSFAICFGQGIPTPTGGTTLGCGTIPAGYTTVMQNADVSLVFDHIQVQMLAGQKPAVDCVFSNLYFGGDLSFIETIKNLIPLDSFSDPPFVNVTTSGITAEFHASGSRRSLNIAIGMFSIQNINIGASLTIPWVSMGGNGITFQFDFCTIDNPFVVTVMMLGGGGFFGMTLDMKGLQRIQFGVEVCAQLAIDLVIASGSVSIEAGIFLVYTVPGDQSGDGPRSRERPRCSGWLIGGYLRLRGELDVAGIITISIELYLQITYSPDTGKCIASGVHRDRREPPFFFLSVHAKVSFTRTFAGSNGDPTFAEMMSPGGIDPMLDPALSATWDPFAEYCMAYA